MTTTSRRPFQDMTQEKWLNLVLAGLLAFNLFYLAWETALGTLCGQMGVDYCDYWSAGKVANSHGYAAMYDLQLLEQVEKGILPISADPAFFATVPFPYLPVFVLPFQLLCRLTPGEGYWIWNAINVAALCWYLMFFARSLGVKPPSIRLMLMLLVSLPVYLNLFSGQANTWLAICIGEFTRALVRARPYRAGLWLGGLLLKPQLLILIGLVLLLRRSIQVLAGLAASSSTILLTSGLLLGGQGLLHVLELWWIYAKGQVSIWTEAMMNWQMVGFHLSAIAGPWVGWGIAATGMFATLALVIYVWGQPFGESSALSPVAVLGILAATTSFVWHSHIHSAMILIPPMLYLRQKGALPTKVWDFWTFLPALLFMIVVFAPQAMTRLNIATDAHARSVYFLIGGAEFAVNQYSLWWAARTTIRTR